MADQEILAWVDPAGVVTVLSDQPDLEVGWDIRGRFMPPIAFIEEDVPAQDGSRLREVRVRPRDVAFPLEVVAATQAALRARLRQVLHLFDPVRGEGRLRITDFDGVMRDLYCHYSSGLEIEESFSAVAGNQRTVVVLRAVDPYWYDTVPQSVTYRSAAPRPFFPLFPLRLSSDTILGSSTVVNDGDVSVFPVWTIHGPATSVTLRNVSTGQVLTLQAPLSDTQSVVIDTRPGRRTVRRNDGTNLFGQLADNARALWLLQPGATEVSVELPGATALSYITLTYSRRWRSA